MFLLDALTTLQFPIRLQLLEDLESLNDGQILSKGEIITVYGYGRQLVLMGSSGLPVEDGDSQDYVIMKPEKELYIPENCNEKMNDVHCNGRVYESVDKLIEQMPRFLRAENDFFTMCVDEDKGMAKIKKDQILEFVRIIDCGKPGQYRNDICQQSDKNLLIYKTNGEEIILTGQTLKSKLICIADKTEYSIKELLVDFSFPRKMEFVNSQLQEQFENLTTTPEPLILDITENPRLFFTSDIIKPFTNTTAYNHDKISLFENVHLLYLSVGKKSRVKVHVVDEAIMKKQNGVFELLFAKEKEVSERMHGNFKTFDIYGRFSQSNSENGSTIIYEGPAKLPEQDIPASQEESESDNFDDKKRKESLGTEMKTPPANNKERRPSGKKHEIQKNYEHIFPVTEKPHTESSTGTKNKTTVVTSGTAAEEAGPTFTELETDVQDRSQSSPKPYEDQTMFTDTDISNKQDSDVTCYSGKRNHSVDETSLYSKSETIPIQRSMSVPTKQRYQASEKERQHQNELPKNIQEEKHEVSQNTAAKDENVDVTCDIKDMGKKQLYQCLQICGLPAFAEQCKTEGIDGDFLVDLEDEELVEEPYFLKKHELRKFHKIKGGWRPKE